MTLNKLKDIIRCIRSRNYLIVTVQPDGMQYGTNICDAGLADIGFFIGETHLGMVKLGEQVKEVLR